MPGKKIFTFLFICALAAVTVLSLLPDPPGTELPFSAADKLEHAAAYAVLALLLQMSLGKRRDLRNYIGGSLFLAGYGLVLEIIQQYTGRNAEAADFIADAAGIALSAGGLILVRKIFCD